VGPCDDSSLSQIAGVPLPWFPNFNEYIKPRRADRRSDWNQVRAERNAERCGFVVWNLGGLILYGFYGRGHSAVALTEAEVLARGS
jgi:hypothetical protein